MARPNFISMLESLNMPITCGKIHMGLNSDIRIRICIFESHKNSILQIRTRIEQLFDVYVYLRYGIPSL